MKAFSKKKTIRKESPSKNVKTDLINNITIIEEELDEDEFPFVSNGKFALLEKLIQPKIGINEKIARWTLRNLDTLRLNVVTSNSSNIVRYEASSCFASDNK